MVSDTKKSEVQSNLLSKDTDAYKSEMNSYDKAFAEEDYTLRSDKAQSATINFYNLITHFYENNWGQSFHFASRHQNESFEASIARHEHLLALKTGIQKDDIVLDCGCGVMGPAREIARFTGAKVVGLNISDYQVNRCEILNNQSSCSHLLSVKKGDFMNIPFTNDYFDKILAIEALCHAPNRLGVYKEIYNKLKPGGTIGFYEWALTKKFDPTNEVHVKAKKMIEYGNSICELGTISDVDRDVKQAGFINITAIDLAENAYQDGNEIPWYSTLEGKLSFANVKHTTFGRAFTHYVAFVLEKIGIAPEGTVRAHSILTTAAEGLVLGGQFKIFTPMYLVIANKPE